MYVKNHKVTSSRNVNNDTKKTKQRKNIQKQEIYKDVYKNI